MFWSSERRPRWYRHGTTRTGMKVVPMRWKSFTSSLRSRVCEDVFSAMRMMCSMNSST
jgi:hypothetical protein